MSRFGDYTKYLNSIPKTAICVSTRNRPEEYLKCITEWCNSIHFSNTRIKLFVVDDASKPKYCDADYRFEERVGIPAVKNKSVELAMDWGAEHIILADDDIYPLKGFESIKPYIDSPFKLLCYTFYKPKFEYENHKYHNKGNGCMMYIHREIIETIGGFDTAYGLGKFEHTEYFERAHRFGLMPVNGFPFIDVVNSHELFYSMDEHKEVKRSFSQDEIQDLLKQNRDHYNASKLKTEYIPYK